MKKDRGNFWFERNDFQSAIHCYRRAIEFSDATDDEMVIFHSSNNTSGNSSSNSSNNSAGKKILTDSQKEADKVRGFISNLVSLRSICYNNLAAAQIKVDALDQALKSVTSSLDLNPNNVKALYRKCRILALKGELTEAIEVLKSAVKIEPESKTLVVELSRLAGLRKKQLDQEKKMYQKMLQVDPSKTPTKKNNNLNNNQNKSLISRSREEHPLLFFSGLTALVAVILGVAIYTVYPI